MEAHTGYIYAFVNISDGKVHCIGQTTQPFEVRIQQHTSDAWNKTHRNPPLMQAIRAETVEAVILDTVMADTLGELYERLDTLEQGHIIEYETFVCLFL